MKSHLVLVLISIASFCYGQSTFTKSLDLSSSSRRNYLNDIIELNSNLFLYSSSFCIEDTVNSDCSFISKMDLNGQLINSILVDSIKGLFVSPEGLCKDDKLIYLSANGKYNYENSGLIYSVDTLLMRNLIFRDSLEGSSIYEIEGSTWLSNYLYLFGNVRNNSSTDDSVFISKYSANGVKKWTNYYSFQKPKLDINSLQSANDSNLSFIVELHDNAGSGAQPGHLIVKVDTAGSIIDSFSFRDLNNQPNRMVLDRMNDFYFGSTSSPTNFNDLYLPGRISKLNRNLQTIEWSLKLPNNPILNGRKYRIWDYAICKNDDILVCGEVYDHSDSQDPHGVPDFNSTWNGFILRLSPTGDLVWYRIYKQLNNLLPVEKFGRFRPSILKKIIELDDGRIAACGEVYVNNLQLTGIDELETEAFHLWVTVVGENGCLANEECQEKILLDNILNYGSTNSLVKPTNVWNEVSYDFTGNPANYSYSCSVDSFFIAGNWYYELLKSHTMSMEEWEETGIFIRQFNDKVYQLIEGSPFLLYDFGLKVGDTFHVAATSTNDSNQLIVTRVEYVEMLNGKNRKILTLLCTDGSDVTSVWIDGIGDIRGVLQGRKTCSFDSFTKLLCHYSNDEIIYRDSIQDKCWDFSSTIDNNKNTLRVYPNPVISKLYIDGIIGTGSLKVYSSTGHLVYSLIIEKNFYEVDLSTLSSGIYFISLIVGESGYIYKFIKI